MRKVNVRLFSILSIALAILAYFSFDITFQGMWESNPTFFTRLAEGGFDVFCFPTVTVASLLHIEMGDFEGYGFLVLDILLYAFLIERIITRFVKKKKS
ncbi:MAG TPA: hypothetical protein VGR89_08005 [Puia sp.]|nr:hypothetical protein [Puia sp.]